MDKLNSINENRIYGLIGERLSHSFSKLVHQRLYDCPYELMEIPRESLDSFMEKHEFSAINVTIPYKQAVIPHLDFVDEKAKKIGAVNTVINNDGKLFGYNTDYQGVIYMLKKADISLLNQHVLILGSGGTCKTLKAVATDLGAASINIASRSPQADTISYENALLLKDTTVIMNASPVGMYPKSEGIPIKLSGFEKLYAVVDAIYNPLNTRLLQEARRLGKKTAEGLLMLVAQAKYAAELFLNSNIPDDKIDEIFSELYISQSNFILIGMPSCGKSRIGKQLALELNRKIIDIDSEIEKAEGKTIPEIFATKGERYFRELETAIIKKLSTTNGAVISTGGGSILKEENIFALKQNGVICFIDRPLEHLLVGNNRPLSTSAETIKSMLEIRLPIYQKTADFSVLNDGRLNDICKEIKNKFMKYKGEKL